MNKKVNLFGVIFASSAVVAASLLVSNNKMSNFFQVKSEDCHHGEVVHYEGRAANDVNVEDSRSSYVEHWACCECHTAWADEARTIVLSNDTRENRNDLDASGVKYAFGWGAYNLEPIYSENGKAARTRTFNLDVESSAYDYYEVFLKDPTGADQDYYLTMYNNTPATLKFEVMKGEGWAVDNHVYYVAPGASYSASFDSSYKNADSRICQVLIKNPGETPVTSGNVVFETGYTTLEECTYKYNWGNGNFNYGYDNEVGATETWVNVESLESDRTHIIIEPNGAYTCPEGCAKQIYFYNGSNVDITFFVLHSSFAEYSRKVAHPGEWIVAPVDRDTYNAGVLFQCSNGTLLAPGSVFKLKTNTVSAVNYPNNMGDNYLDWFINWQGALRYSPAPNKVGLASTIDLIPTGGYTWVQPVSPLEMASDAKLVLTIYNDNDFTFGAKYCHPHTWGDMTSPVSIAPGQSITLEVSANFWNDVDNIGTENYEKGIGVILERGDGQPVYGSVRFVASFVKA